MLIKILLGLMFFGFVSCASDYEIVSYSINGNVEKVMSGEALENFKEIYPQATMQELMPYFENVEMFKLLFQNRLFESKLIVAEALSISDFTAGAQFIDTLSHRSNTLPYEIAYTKGIEIISNDVANQSLPLAEVSRIMITNDLGLANAVLQELLVTENPVTDFSIAAEQYSDEYLGAQRGGYMGRIFEGQFPAADDIIFEQGFEGIYPQVLRDQYGSYLVFVHTKARDIKVKDFEKEGISIPFESMINKYISDHIAYDFVQVNEDTLFLSSGGEVGINDLVPDDVLLTIWDKDYTFEELKFIVEMLISPTGTQQVSNADLISLLVPPTHQSVSAVYQIAIIFKGYSDSIKNSKEYKDEIADMYTQLELEMAYPIIQQAIYAQIDTNVSAQEITNFYEANKPVISYGADGVPIYATYEDSAPAIHEAIVNQRAEVVFSDFKDRLDMEYQIIWNDENLEKFMDEFYDDFDKYLKTH